MSKLCERSAREIYREGRVFNRNVKETRITRGYVNFRPKAGARQRNLVLMAILVGNFSRRPCERARARRMLYWSVNRQLVGAPQYSTYIQVGAGVRACSQRMTSRVCACARGFKCRMGWARSELAFRGRALAAAAAWFMRRDGFLL